MLSVQNLPSPGSTQFLVRSPQKGIYWDGVGDSQGGKEGKPRALRGGRQMTGHPSLEITCGQEGAVDPTRNWVLPGDGRLQTHSLSCSCDNRMITGTEEHSILTDPSKGRAGE